MVILWIIWMMVWCNPGGTYLMDYLLLYIIFFFEEDVDIKYIKIIYIYKRFSTSHLTSRLWDNRTRDIFPTREQDGDINETA